MERGMRKEMRMRGGGQPRWKMRCEKGRNTAKSTKGGRLESPKLSAIRYSRAYV